VKIEFDGDKRDLTLKHRRLDMARAAEVFAGPTLTVKDDRAEYGEDRYISIGHLDGRMVVLVWTPRGAARRISVCERRMRVSKKSTARGWVDRDEAPDLSRPKWQEKLAAAPVKRGRPKAAVTKISTTIRLDADILKALKSTGAGWQTRANGILRTRLLSKGKAIKRS
jgi:uncharacterized protein (DUF4415 family)